MSFKLSLWKTKMKNISTSHENNDNNTLDQVLIGNVRLLQSQKWMGQIWTCLKRSPSVSLKSKVISTWTNIRYGLPELQLCHVPRLCGGCVSGLVNASA